MKKTKMIALAISLLILQVWGILNAATLSNKKVVVFGDGFANSIAKLVEENTGAQVIDAGKTNDIAINALARLDADVLSQKPDLVIVSLGENDALLGRNSWETDLDISMIIDRSVLAGAKVIFLGEGGEYYLPDKVAYIPKEGNYESTVQRMLPTIRGFLRDLPSEPTLYSVYTPGTSPSLNLIRLEWESGIGFVYEIIGLDLTPNPYNSWHVVATVKGVSGRTWIALQVDKPLAFYRLRVKAEQ